MNRETISGLSELTGFDRRTVKSRLATLEPKIEGSAHLYRTEEALPHLYRRKEDDIELRRERSRLTHHQANLLELAEKELEAELVSTDEVVDLWETMKSNARKTFLALPIQLVSQMRVAGDHKSAQNILQSGIRKALDEFSNDS